MSEKLSLLYLLFSLVLFSLTGGCVFVASPSYGMQERMEVDRLFEAGTILTDHIYYTEGPEKNPDAIIAISKDFQLQTQFWTQRDWVEKDLKDAVFWMQTEDVGFCITNGGVLIAPDGQQIGVWYSRRDLSAIRQPAPGVVEVFPFSYRPGSPCYHQDIIDRR